jgi:cathepsin B
MVFVIFLHLSQGNIMGITRQNTVLLSELAPWEVAKYEDNVFKDWTVEEIKQMLQVSRSSTKKPLNSKVDYTNIPRNYDPRNDLNDCLNEIKDQGTCGGSWGIAVADTLGDRFCRKGRGDAKSLSGQFLISCDTTNYGCNGGFLYQAWIYTEKKGTVSENCFPYVSNTGEVPACPETCKDGSKLVHYKTQHSTTIDLSYDIQNIMRELVNEGSITMSMIVYQDFMYYKSGIYRHVQGIEYGRQAVRCVGYGEEVGIPYWLCANSWSKSWGMEGYFKIQHGEAEIEGDAVAGKPKIDSLIE